MDVAVLAFLVAAIIIILGFLGEEFFKRTSIPDPLLLLLLGVLLGPIFQFFAQEELLAITPYFSALALIIILFDGGLNMNIKVSIIGGDLILEAYNESAYNSLNLCINKLSLQHKVVYEDNDFILIGYIDKNEETKTICKGLKVSDCINSCDAVSYRKIIFCNFDSDLLLLNELDFELDFELN